MLPINPESETAKFTFTNKAELTLNLLTPHQSYWVDIDTFATYTTLPDGTLDLNLLRATENLRVDNSDPVRAAPAGRDPLEGFLFTCPSAGDREYRTA